MTDMTAHGGTPPIEIIARYRTDTRYLTAGATTKQRQLILQAAAWEANGHVYIANCDTLRCMRDPKDSRKQNPKWSRVLDFLKGYIGTPDVIEVPTATFRLDRFVWFKPVDEFTYDLVPKGYTLMVPNNWQLAAQRDCPKAFFVADKLKDRWEAEGWINIKERTILVHKQPDTAPRQRKATPTPQVGGAKTSGGSGKWCIIRVGNGQLVSCPENEVPKIMWTTPGAVFKHGLRSAGVAANIIADFTIADARAGIDRTINEALAEAADDEPF